MAILTKKLAEDRKDLAVFSKRAKEPTVSYEKMVKKLKAQDQLDIKVAQKRMKSAEFVGHKEMKTYLRRRGIKLNSDEKEIKNCYPKFIMKPRISLVTLGVSNLKESIKFYEKGLGLPRMSIESNNVAFFNLNGTWLSLYPLEELAKDANVSAKGTGFRGITLSHNVSSKAEVCKVMVQAQKAGAKIQKTAQDVFWGGYSGYFADPDGHLWEVAWNPHFWPGPK